MIILDGGLQIALLGKEKTCCQDCGIFRRQLSRRDMQIPSIVPFLREYSIRKPKRGVE